MSLTVRNRIQGLVDAMYGLMRPDNKQRAMMEQAQRGGELTMFAMRRNSPRGQVEESWTTPTGRTIAHGRPSIRQHGTTLAWGWVSELDPLIDGAAFTLTNIAPHAKYVFEGTPPHDIPGPVSFWWGAPMRWPQKDRFPAGPRYFERIANHPGTPAATDRVEQTANEVRGRWLEFLRTGTYQVLNPLRNFFRS